MWFQIFWFPHLSTIRSQFLVSRLEIEGVFCEQGDCGDQASCTFVKNCAIGITSIYRINMVLCIKLINFLMEKHKVLVDRKNEKIVEIKAFLSSL
jgi:hypothetical protein